MPSILPGYEYDIFISYRHKDNRSKWVTEFVDALKNEIEATFKEDISIYFDSNPHDGLNDNHDVDASLKEKVKCLVFIPIVSQTYCDPDSFAWKSELLPFLTFAKSDKHGLDIKVGSGNVTKRTLPILINDIDEKDRSLFETQTNGFLRSIDFIYSETGVNRPLLPSDKKDDNSHKTEYRNQVNKVANAVKDMVYSMSGKHAENQSVKTTSTSPISTARKGPKISMKWLGIVTVLILLSAIAYFVKNSFSKSESDPTGTSSKALAVMYFENLTGNEALSWLQAGMVEMLITNLAVNHELDLLSSQGLYTILRNETDNDELKISLETAGRIAEKANVGFMVIGSYLGGNEESLRVNTQLINVESGKVEDTWVLETNSTQSVFQLADTLSLLIRKRFGPISEDSRPKQNLTYSLEAQKNYIEGLQYLYRADFANAVKSLETAVSVDTAFAMAYYQLSVAASYSGVGTKVDSPRKKALDNSSRLNQEWADFLQVMSTEGTRRQVRISQLKEYVNKYPRNKDAWLALGEDQFHTYWQKESVESFRKAIDLDPFYAIGYFHMMDYFVYAHQIDSARHYSDKILELEPENINANLTRAALSYYKDRDKQKFSAQFKNIINDDDKLFNFFQNILNLNKNEQYAQSIDLCTELLETSTRYEVINLTTSTFMLAGKSNMALQTLKKAINLFPGKMQLLYQMGINQFLLEDYTGAMSTIEEMEDFQDRFPVEESLKLHLKGIVYTEMGNSTDAKTALNKLEQISLQQNGSFAYFINDINARISMKNGEYPDAERKFRESLSDLFVIEYNLVDFYDFSSVGLAEALFKQDKTEELNAVLEQTPIPWLPNIFSSPSAILKYQLELLNARVYIDKGEIEKADEVLSKIIKVLENSDKDFLYYTKAKEERVRIQ